MHSCSSTFTSALLCLFVSSVLPPTLLSLFSYSSPHLFCFSSGCCLSSAPTSVPSKWTLASRLYCSSALTGGRGEADREVWSGQRGQQQPGGYSTAHPGGSEEQHPEGSSRGCSLQGAWCSHIRVLTLRCCFLHRVNASLSLLQEPADEHVVVVADKNCNVQNASARSVHMFTFTV